MDKSIKKIKVPVEQIDEDVRGLVVALNELPFLITTGSCSGHTYRTGAYSGGRHTAGYILMQSHKKALRGDYCLFRDGLREFLGEYNLGNSTQFDLTDLTFLGPNLPSRIGFYPAFKKDMWPCHLDGTMIYDSQDKKDLREIPRKRRKAWKELEGFVTSYQRKS